MRSRTPISAFALCGQVGLALCILVGSAAAQTYSIGANFTGTTLNDERNILGFGFIPPNAGGAVGPSHVAELLNGAFAVYNRSGVLQPSSRISSDSFWNAAFTQAGTSGTVTTSVDPRILYDPASQRWYAAAVTGAGTANSQILIGVTTGSDPSLANWRGFNVKADIAQTPTRWADFVTLGMNGDGVHLTASMFGIDPNVTPLPNTISLSIPKASLTGGIPSINNFVLNSNQSASGLGLVAQPAFEPTGGHANLPILSLNLSGVPNRGRISNYSVDPNNFPGTLQINVPGLTNLTLQANPPLAHQPGPNDDLYVIDSRQSTTVFQRNNSLWSVHGTSVGGRAALEFYRFDLTNRTISQSATISDPSLDLYEPSLAVNEFGDVVIGFSGSSDTTPISAYFVVGKTTGNSTAFSSLVQSKAGTGTYHLLDQGNPALNRWGDYSSTVVDPNNPYSFWTFQEFVDGNDNWAIQATQILVPEPATAVLALLGLAGVWVVGRRRIARR